MKAVPQRARVAGYVPALNLGVNKLKQLPAGRQVIIMVGALCTILVLVGMLLFFGLRAIERNNQKQLTYVVDESRLVAAALQNVGLMQTVVFRHILATTPAQIELRDQSFREIDKANGEALAAYQRFVDTEEEGRLYARVLNARKEYMELTDQLLALSRVNRDAEAGQFAVSKQIPAYEDYTKAIKDVTDYVDNEVRDIVATLNHRIARIRMVCDVFVIIAILVAIGTGLAVAGVARRLKDDNRTLQIEITERKRARAESESLHKQLMEASRRGGMAEIATNVLHNVGNVLNSVNVSAGLIVERVRKSRIASLGRVVVLLREHAHDLGEFITTDERGKHVPAHLAQLSEHLLADQEAIVLELELLRRNVEHIKEIVAMQQNYATVGGVKEIINVVNLVEDSMRMNEGAMSRHGVEVIREFEKVPPMNIEKHKILQILVNLLRNAKYACDESGQAEKRLTVRVARDDGRVRISVIDNGVGIPPENLTRIFNHGFTTRKGGHGFGLHSGALAAKEMGGSLSVQSGGPGQGAAFTLELPCPTQENSHE